MNKIDYEEKRKSFLASMIQDGVLPGESREDYEQRTIEGAQHSVRRRMILVAIIASVIVLAILGYKFYQNHYRYQKAVVKWEKEISMGTFAGYTEFGANIIKYTRDGAVCMNKKGEELWNQPYTMSSPVVSVNGSYAAIADKGGYSIYICNEEGNQGNVTTTLPIAKVKVSATGITVAILEAPQSNYIKFFDKDGNTLQIEVQTTLSGNGYPVDLDIAPGGSLLMVSYVYLDKGVMENQVVFYNFDEEGQSIKDRLVGGFKEFGNNMAARVKFLDNTHAVAFAQDRICVYLLENTIKPKLQTQIMLEEEVMSVLYSGTNFGVITRDEEGQKRLTLYNFTGSQTAKTKINMEYTTARLSGDYVLLYRDVECAIYNLNGNLKYQGALSGNIDELVYLGTNKFLQIGPQSMMQIELK